jgi:hypothetical protein
MSRTIDERIVEMRFDNRQFERNVQTSLSTLDKLKQGLDLDGAAKGLENLGDAAKKCNMSALSSSVETVRAKFSALEVVAMTTLSNITNSAPHPVQNTLYIVKKAADIVERLCQAVHELGDAYRDSAQRNAVE